MKELDEIVPLIQMGYSLIPVDQNKKALITWKQCQINPLSETELRIHLDKPETKIAMLGGVRNVECIDLDTKNIEIDSDPHKLESILEGIRSKIPNAIYSKLIIQTTPSGGGHLIYRCSEVQPNQILVRNSIGRPIVETRGKGGYFVISPSSGYVLLQGGFDELQELSPQERNELFVACKSVFKSSPVPSSDDIELSTDINYSERNGLYSAVEACIQQLEGRKIDITSSYNDWVKIGFALVNTFSKNGRSFFHRISQFYPSYDFQECEDKYTSLLTATPKDSKSSLKQFFDMCSTYGITAKIGDQKTAAKFDFVMEFLKSKGIRYNEFTNKVELKNGDEFSDRTLNSIYAELQQIGMSVSQDYIHSLVKSDFIPSYNPLKDFLAYCEKLEYSDELDRFLACFKIHSKDSEHEKSIKSLILKWLLQIPAVVLDDEIPRLMLVLIGESNIGKTHLFRHFLPEELKSYYAESALNREKDSLILMGEKLLVNNDEFGGLMTLNEWEHFKFLASAEHFYERPPYGRSTIKMRRKAILSGTSNKFAIINDHTTNNTRIIPIEISGIDQDLFNCIDKCKLMSALVHEYKMKGKESIRLSSEECLLLADHSTDYQTVNLEREVILQYFEPGNEFMSTAKILGILKSHTSVQLIPGKIAHQLKQLGFESTRRRIGDKQVRGWLVNTKPNDFTF